MDKLDLISPIIYQQVFHRLEAGAGRLKYSNLTFYIWFKKIKRRNLLYVR